MTSTSLGYDYLDPTEPIGLLILIIGILFTILTFLVFINASQDKDSIADKKRKKRIKHQQAQNISKLYPKGKNLF